MDDFSILIGGKAGDGIKQAANTISRLIGRLGYTIFFYDDYPSLIRGGHNFSIIRAASTSILSHEEEVDCIIALNQDTVEKHRWRLRPGGVVIFDSNALDGVDGIGVPFEDIVKAHSGIAIMKNIAAIGALAKVVGIDFERVGEIIKATVPRGVEKNIEIAKTAYEAAQSHTGLSLKPLASDPMPVVTGNEAIALGATRAGLDLYIAYPMTPASSILHFFASNGAQLGITTVHPESEIGAVLMAIGASYAGRRAMTGTSGGGFALMTEALSLASMAEIPLVIVECQRTGPSTGVPTYTMQADLLFALFAGHGDQQKIVVAPGDAEEAYEWAYNALNAAWYFQVPVLLLSDKHLSESAYSFKEPKELFQWPRPVEEIEESKGYKRYHVTSDGISPMLVPGTRGAVVKATSYEHDEYGITVEDQELVKAMQDKRLRKWETIKGFMERFDVVKKYGTLDGETVLIFWGSTKGAAVEACNALGIRGVQPIVLEPFPKKAMKDALRGAGKVILAETNATGQLAKLLRCNGIEVHEQILRYDGRPFTPKGLIQAVKEAL